MGDEDPRVAEVEEAMRAWYCAAKSIHNAESIPRAARDLVARLDNVVAQEHRREARHVLGARKGQVVHHIDGDPRNHSPENLRIVDPQENTRGGQES